MEPFGTQWNKKHEKAFQEISHRLICDQVLTFADPSMPFVLNANASLEGLQLVQCQEVR